MAILITGGAGYPRYALAKLSVLGIAGPVWDRRRRDIVFRARRRFFGRAV